MNPVTSSTFPFDDEEGIVISPKKTLTKDEQLGSIGLGILVMLFLVMIINKGRDSQ